MKLLMFGPPGAGKGTQAKKLAETFSIPHISSGDLLRAAIANRTDLGMKAKEYIDKGLLVPDDVMIDMICDVISLPAGAKGFILDGFPRTIPQAEALDRKLKELKMEIDKVISLEVDPQKILSRFTNRRTCRSCGHVFNLEKIGKTDKCPDCGGELYLRDDDNEATIKKRMEVYFKMTNPLKDFYRMKNVLAEINGMAEVDVVFNSIMKALSCKNAF